MPRLGVSAIESRPTWALEKAFLILVKTQGREVAQSKATKRLLDGQNAFASLSLSPQFTSRYVRVDLIKSRSH